MSQTDAKAIYTAHRTIGVCFDALWDNRFNGFAAIP
jgi:hypothetical protein